MGWLGLVELTEQVGRKVHSAPVLPLVALKGLAVEEAENASRKPPFPPCWFLSEISCKTVFLRRVIMHVAFLCAT